MKIFVFIAALIVAMSASAQHVIKVKKGQTITGAFYWESEDKTKDYLFFTEEGYVYIIENTKKNPKKALKLFEACTADPSCQEIQSKAYSFEKNIINFSFDNTSYVKDYNGQFEDAGSKIVFKVTETDKLMVVREYERIE